MQRAVVTEQKMRNLNVRQENAMFNLAAVQSVVPLRECKLSAWPPLFNGFINDALLQLSPDTGKALLQIIDVPNRCLIDAFLYQPPDPIVNWIEVW